MNSIKLKYSQATYPTYNAKSLACDTANEQWTCANMHKRDMQLQSDSSTMEPMAIIYGKENYSDS